MATFQVPQFVDQKAKIVGPLTLKQFLYLIVPAGISLFSFYTFAFVLWILVTAVVGAVGIALAFVKIHGRELPSVLFHGFRFVWQPRTYTWRREAAKSEQVDTSSLERLQALRRKAEMQERLNSVKTFVTTHAKRGPRVEEAAKQTYQTVERLTGEQEQARRVDYS